MTLAEKLRSQTESAKDRIKKEQAEKEAKRREEELASEKSMAWSKLCCAAQEGLFAVSVHTKPFLAEAITSWLVAEGVTVEMHHFDALGLRVLWVSWEK